MQCLNIRVHAQYETAEEKAQGAIRQLKGELLRAKLGLESDKEASEMRDEAEKLRQEVNRLETELEESGAGAFEAEKKEMSHTCNR